MTSAYERNRKKRPKAKGYSLEELGVTKENFVDFYKKWKNNELQFIDTELVGNQLQAEWERLSSDKANIHEKRLKKLLIGVGDTYSDMRTVDSDEWKGGFKDPIDLTNKVATAGILRGLEGVGWVADKTLGAAGRWTGKNILGLDEGNQQLMGIAAQFAAPSVLKRIPKIPKSPAVKQAVYNAGVKVGQQYRAGKQLTKNLKKVYDENLSKTPSKRVVNVKAESIIDEGLNTPNYKDIVRIAKKNNISLSKAKAWVDLKTKAIRPDQTLNPGTNAGLLEGDIPLNKLHARLIQQGKNRGAMYDKDGNPIDPKLKTDPSLLIGNILNIGDKGFSYGKGINKLTAPEFIDQRFQSYGFKRGPNGGWFLDRETYYKLPPNQQREIIQIMQTAVDQTVPQSFTIDKLKKNLQLNKDLAAYNAKYGARAELHHSFPSALSAEFFLDKEYMGPEWREMIRIANDEFNNYPGQPFGVDENSNLVAVPSKIGSNHPNYDAVVAKYGKVPPHLHNIIHSQFFANETGMSGKKFFTQDRLAKMDEGFEGELEVWREWNAIIKRNREMWEEALAQLDVFFSKASLSENPEKLTELLEQYLSKGKIIVGQGLVRDKDGNVILSKKGTDTALGKMETATYAQFPVNDIVKTALADFKKDADLLFSKDPRLADVINKVAEIPGLTAAEKELLEELLLKITHYNSIVVTDGRRRAYHVTGITASEHIGNIKKYNDMRQLKIPNLQFSDVDVKSRVFPDIKLPNIEKQMELILDEQLELDL